MRNIRRSGPSQFMYKSKEEKRYAVTLTGNDTTTIQIFDLETGNPLPMNGDEKNVKIWDDVETYLFYYYDKVS